MGKAMETCWQAKAEDEGVEEMHEDMIECIQDVGINFKLNFKKVVKAFLQRMLNFLF